MSIMSFLLIIKTWVVDNHNMCNFNYTVMPHTKDTKISQYAKKSYQNLRVTITLCDVSFFLAFLWLDFPESVDKRNAKSTINVFHFFLSFISLIAPRTHLIPPFIQIIKRILKNETADLLILVFCDTSWLLHSCSIY